MCYISIMENIQYKFTKVNQEEVVRLYNNNYTILEICIELKTTEYIVYKILKLNGLKSGTKVDRLKDKYQDIIDLYKETNRLSIVAREFNITKSLVEKVLKMHNISKREVVKELNTGEVIDYYNKTRKVKLVANRFGVSNSFILKLLHKNNVRISKLKYSDEEIIEYYLKVKTIKKVCDDLKISDSKVSDVLKTNNIELLTLRRKSIGDVYGKLTIIDEILLPQHIKKNGSEWCARRQFKLKCECGGFIILNSNSIDKRKSLDCGCVSKERKLKKEEEKRIKEEQKRIRLENYHKRLIEQQEKKKLKEDNKQNLKYYVGMVKHKLTILSIMGDNWKVRKFLCKCECGTIKEFRNVNFYNVKSCGCLMKINRVKASTKHGMTSKYGKWYHRWKGMIRRCYDPKMPAYSNYGGRGIKVCDRWRESNGQGCENYYNDIHTILGPQPSPIHSLDRIDNDGNYEITNLRWATNSEQAKNKRRFLKKNNKLDY